MKKTLMKICVSLLFAFLLAQMTDLSGVWYRLRHINLVAISACILLVWTGQAISSLRWRWILEAEGANVSLRYLFSSYMVGMFANNFLPTSIGGDLIKTYDVYRATKNLSLSLASVFVERFSGLLVLIAFSWVGISLVWSSSSHPVIWSWIIINSIATLIIAIIFEGNLISLLLGRIEVGIFAGPAAMLRKCFDIITTYKHRKMFFLKLVTISVPVQLMTILVYILIAASLSIELPFYYYLFGVPLIIIISLLPFSLGGLGIREAATVLIFGIAGTGSEAALSLAIMVTAVTYMSSLLGGLFLLFRGMSIREISKSYRAIAS